MRPGTVHPQRLVKNLAELRWHPGKIEGDHILPFVPEAAKVDQEKDKRLSTLAKIICECSSIQSAGLALLHHEAWSFAAVYFDALDHFSHAFMRYHPPRLEWVPEEDFEPYKGVVEGGYHLHDIYLGQLLEEAGPETTVIMVSDHGFHPDNLRPQFLPDEPAGPAMQHRHYGIFVMKGPGVKKDERVYGASLLDVCPTMLTLFGLPPGRDMDGKVLVDVFEDPPRPRPIDSWDPVPGEAGMHDPDKRIDPVEATEALNQLVALGYIEKPDEDRGKAVANTVRELDYNLARSYMDAGRHGDAVPLLERLMEKFPEEDRFGTQLFFCFQVLERIPDARRVIEKLMADKKETVQKSATELRKWHEENKDKKPEDLTDQERHKLQRLRTKASRNPFMLNYLMGSLLFLEGDEQGALRFLERAEKADQSLPGLYIKIGTVYMQMGRWPEADRCFEKTLSMDPDRAEAHLCLAGSLLAQHRNREAVVAAKQSVSLLFHNPRGHFLLGVGLHRMRRLDDALQALKTAVAQNPNFVEAHRRLAYIYKRRLHDHLKAGEHQLAARQIVRRRKQRKKGVAAEALQEPETPRLVTTLHPKGSDHGTTPSSPVPAGSPEKRDKTIFVVTGLPRSGTSMMMQMLEAAGIPPLTDGKRAADEHNPWGYYEHEKAPKLRQENKWLEEARGKSVKIVAQLLPWLPPRHSYRVVFTRRDLDDILRSQKRMLADGQTGGAELEDEKLKPSFPGKSNKRLRS